MTDLERALAAGGKVQAAPASLSGPPPDSDLARALAAGGKVQAVQDAPSVVESAARGALQGASLGFGDEVAAAIDTGVSKIPGLRTLAQHLQPSDLPALDKPDLTYAQRRDAYRAKNAAASKENPIAYGAGEVAGGLATAVVPVGGAAKGAGFLAHAAKGAEAGAILGGASGLGNSEADSFTGQIRDALHGAAAGGIAGGVLGGAAGKLVEGAPGRADKRVLSEIGDKALPTTRAKLAAKATDVVGVAREHGLDKVAKKPGKLAEAARAAANDVGDRIGSIYSAADEIGGGVAVPKVTEAMQAVAKELDSNPATKSLARRVAQQIEDVQSTWGDNATVPAAELRKFVTGLQTSVAGAEINPGVAKKVGRQLSGAVKDVLDGYVKEAAARAAPDVAEQLTALPTLNKQYHALSLIGDAAKKRAQVAEFSPTGLRDIAEKVGHGGLGVLSAATGHLPGFLAAEGAMKAAPAVGRAADSALAKVVNAARAGSAGADLVQKAIEAGFPRVTAEKVAAAVAANEGAAP